MATKLIKIGSQVRYKLLDKSGTCTITGISEGKMGKARQRVSWDKRDDLIFDTDQDFWLRGDQIKSLL